MATSSTKNQQADSGFGMVEIVVAMFLLGILSLMILPVIISAMTLASKNVTIATATQLSNQQVDVARSLPSSCASLTAFADETLGLRHTDPRGTVLVVDRAAVCPLTYPGVVTFTSSVGAEGATEGVVQLDEAGDPDYLAETTTSIFVTCAAMNVTGVCLP